MELLPRPRDAPTVGYHLPRTAARTAREVPAYRARNISADKTCFLNVSAPEVFIRVSDYADLNNVKAVVLRIPPGQNRDLGGPPAGK